MESEEDLVERLIARLPIEEAEECLCQMEENLITVDVLRSAEQEDLEKELGFTARQCDAVLLDDTHWRAKYEWEQTDVPDASSETSKGERESGGSAISETASGEQNEREASAAAAAAIAGISQATVHPAMNAASGGRGSSSGIRDKLQVVIWRGASKCLPAWKEALDAQTVELDDIDDDGNTLLHMAAGQGHKLLVKELLRRGADPTVTNVGGKTCYDAAHQLNQWELGDYIRGKLGLHKIGPKTSLPASLPASFQESHPESEQMLAQVGEILKGMAAQGKMSMQPAVLQGKFGTIQLFGRSLEERLGGMSDDPVSGLFSEHCLASDSGLFSRKSSRVRFYTVNILGH
jgi:hypothetical protein